MLFDFIVRKLRFWSSIKKAKSNAGASEHSDTPEAKMDKALMSNLDGLKSLFTNSSDLKIHVFRFGPDNGIPAALAYIDGLVNEQILSDAILHPLMLWHADSAFLPSGTDLMDMVKQEVLWTADVKTVSSISELAAGCLNGNTALMIDGCPSSLSISAKGFEKRSVTTPQTETVVRGPREGFTENLRTNTSLIRRKIRDAHLHVEQMILGRKTQTVVCLMYLEGVANPKIVETVKGRIERLDVEAIFETGYIEEYIEDAPFSPFATIGYSEKPDVVAANILEGRIAIVVDGTPFVLTVPMLFIESFQSAEDYYARPLYASLVRILRFLAYLIAVFAPAVFIALSSFHHELIPTTLLFTIAKARGGTPFPVFVEALIMIFAFEILREAGIRLPQPIGQAISIVGALIMGDAAVSAGLVGAPMVITIALTAVASFLVPTQNDSISILRIVMTIPTAFVGFYGLAMGALAVLVHLASLESFGVPYFDSFDSADDAKDTLIRAPLWTMLKRPKGIARGDTTRSHFFIPPLRPFAPDDDIPERRKS
ncbi:MAG TPA: spore germination protein [Clostridia bacterium]|nr:spore germination protein [Clostridia bacterium]